MLIIKLMRVEFHLDASVAGSSYCAMCMLAYCYTGPLQWNRDVIKVISNTCAFPTMASLLWKRLSQTSPLILILKALCLKLKLVLSQFNNDQNVLKIPTKSSSPLHSVLRQLVHSTSNLNQFANIFANQLKLNSSNCSHKWQLTAKC